MCLGIPGRVLDVAREDDVLMGRVEFAGIAKRVCLEHVADVKPGEYVIVHVGFALSKVDEDEAQRVFAFLAGMDQLDELDVPQDAARNATRAGPPPPPALAATKQPREGGA